MKSKQTGFLEVSGCASTFPWETQMGPYEPIASVIFSASCAVLLLLVSLVSFIGALLPSAPTCTACSARRFTSHGEADDNDERQRPQISSSEARQGEEPSQEQGQEVFEGCDEGALRSSWKSFVKSPRRSRTSGPWRRGILHINRQGYRRYARGR